LAQANQIALLKIEKRLAVDQGVQQAGFDDEELLCRQLGAEVIGVLELKVRARWLQTFQQL